MHFVMGTDQKLLDMRSPLIAPRGRWHDNARPVSLWNMPGYEDPSKLDELLVSFAASGDIPGIKKLFLTVGVGVDGSPHARTSPLFAAVSFSKESMVAFLICEGADVEYSIPHEVESKDGEVLISKGLRPVHAAVMARDIISLRLLLQAGASPNSVDAAGRTPLVIACKLSDLDETTNEIVRQLLEAGSDASLGDSRNQTPLFWAATQGDETAVSLLLSAGARNVGSAATHTCPLQAAVIGAHQRIVRLLVPDGCKAVGGQEALSKALAAALFLGHAKILNLLLSMSPPPVTDFSIQVPAQRVQWTWESKPFTLHRAAALGNLAMIAVLLAAGMDEAKKDSSGTSTFDVAGTQMPVAKRGPEWRAAICRVLHRGPAFRARSWAWPAVACAAGKNKEDGATICSSGDPQPAPRLRLPPFRAKSKDYFGRLFGR